MFVKQLQANYNVNTDTTDHEQNKNLFKDVHALTSKEAQEKLAEAIKDLATAVEEAAGKSNRLELLSLSGFMNVEKKLAQIYFNDENQTELDGEIKKQWNKAVEQLKKWLKEGHNKCISDGKQECHKLQGANL